ncbi:MAG: hypothetical protein P4N41_23160 [Negativicutes bacterium]|nr:hypothetical protein [Negativicutes bacterium]
MEDQDIFSRIQELQTDIFDARIDVLPGKFASLSTGLAASCRSIPSRSEPYFRQILLALLRAYESRDFLLLADVLEFELKPLLVDAMGGDDRHGNL